MLYSSPSEENRTETKRDDENRFCVYAVLRHSIVSIENVFFLIFYFTRLSDWYSV